MNPLLMKAQIAREMLDYPAWPPWVEGRDPPKDPKSYLTVCRNGDGAIYINVHYWHNTWHSAGPFVKVIKWMELPPV